MKRNGAKCEHTTPTHPPSPDVTTAWDLWYSARRRGPAPHPGHLLPPVPGGRRTCGCGADFYRPGREGGREVDGRDAGERGRVEQPRGEKLGCTSHKHVSLLSLLFLSYRGWTHCATTTIPWLICFAILRFSSILSATTVRASIHIETELLRLLSFLECFACLSWCRCC
jgi:hypothetical protein